MNFTKKSSKTGENQTLKHIDSYNKYHCYTLQNKTIYTVRGVVPTTAPSLIIHAFYLLLLKIHQKYSKSVTLISKMQTAYSFLGLHHQTPASEIHY